MTFAAATAAASTCARCFRRQKLVSALRTAALAISHLAPRASADESSAIAFNAACTEFLQLVKDVHAELAGHIHLVSDYRVYGRSTYGADKDVDITREKVKVVSEQLQALSRFLEEHYVADDSATQ